MDAHYAVFYVQDNRDKSTTTCYGHGGAKDDKIVNQDALLYYCETNDPKNHPCGTDYTDTVDTTGGQWRKTTNGYRGLSQLYNFIRDCVRSNRVCTESPALPSGAERTGRSRRLWLLSTAAAAWALLRR
jgi:hypothetical protein